MMDVLKICDDIVMKTDSSMEPVTVTSISSAGLSEMSMNILGTSLHFGGRRPSTTSPVIFVKTQPEQQPGVEPLVKKRKIISITPVYKTNDSKNESSDTSVLSESTSPNISINNNNNSPTGIEKDKGSVIEQLKLSAKDLSLKFCGESIESNDFTCVKLDEFSSENQPSTSSVHSDSKEKRSLVKHKSATKSKQNGKKSQSRSVPSILRKSIVAPTPTNSKELMNSDVHSFIQKFVPRKLREPIYAADDFILKFGPHKRSKSNEAPPSKNCHKPASILRSSEDSQKYRFNCHHCRTKFRTMASYEEHLANCRKNNPVRDPLEFRLTNRAKDRSRPRTTNAKEESLKCVDCDQVWNALDVTSVLKHKMFCPFVLKVDCSRDDLACPICEENCGRIVQVMKHCEIVHGFRKFEVVNTDPELKRKKRE